MRRVLLLVAALAVVALVATSGAAADATYTDPAGDGKGGPDVTAVAVTNDAAGVVTIKITAAGLSNAMLAVFMDTDMNARFDDATGRALMLMVPGPGMVLPMAFGFDGNGDPTPVPLPPSLRVSATSTDVSITFAKGDLGIAESFAFWVAGFTPSDDLGDEAPDTGLWIYAVTPPPPPPPPPPPADKPVIGKPVATPAVAGKPMTVTFAVTSKNTGAPMLTGTMTCDPSVSSKALAHRESFKGGKAKLAFTVPKTAKGKVLKVKVTITSTDGLATTRVAPFKVR